ncbi:MAG: Lrp/AsnC family transcriptional regulator [Candidatus Bathyarchaeota archaeon]|nr:MAG: Lrp/AsnC family transcriptional regulator [Candidatus Bathyarchaeota archaeon]
MPRDITAYVLFVVTVGNEYEVASTLQSLPNVTAVDVVYGEYDIIATFVGESLRALDSAITSARKLDTVTKTLTLIAG